MTPAGLWLRRVLAFVLDHSLAVLVVAALLFPFPDQGLRLPRPLLHLRTQACVPLETPPRWLADWAGDQTFSVLRLCFARLYGIADGIDLVAVLEGPVQGDGSRPVRAIRQPVRADLTPVANLPGVPGLLVLALMGFASALLTRAGRPSPGKALLRLRLVGPPARAPLREVLRLGPLAILPATTQASTLGLVAPPLLWGLGVTLALALAGAGFVLVYYLWPLLRGTAPWHDRLSGFRLVRAV